MTRQIRDNLVKITMAGLLIAIGILIPMVSPIKFVMGPASFTLASHVAIFIAMFISPAVALAVAVGTTIGFFVGGFIPVIVLRAASHIVFALLGSIYLRMRLRNTAKEGLSVLQLRAFSLTIAIIHAFCELVVVSFFYFGGNLVEMFYEQGFFTSVVLLIGLGSVIHSLVDFEIAQLVLLPLRKQENTAKYFA